MRQFLIVYAGRCGSTWLSKSLDAQPEVRCEGELLHPGSRFHGIDSISDRSGILDFLSHESGMGTQAVGFKFSPFHLAPKHHDGDALNFSDASAIHAAVRYMADWSSGNHLVIYIRRLNRVEQYASLLMARATGQWGSAQRYRTDISFTVDPEDYLSWSRECRSVDMALAEWVESLSDAAVSITYEEMAVDIRPALTRCLHLLAIEPAELRVPNVTVKSQHRPLNYVIRNLPQVQEWDRTIAKCESIEHLYSMTSNDLDEPEEPHDRSDRLG